MDNEDYAKKLVELWQNQLTSFMTDSETINSTMHLMRSTQKAFTDASEAGIDGKKQKESAPDNTVLLERYGILIAELAIKLADVESRLAKLELQQVSAGIKRGDAKEG